MNYFKKRQDTASGIEAQVATEPLADALSSRFDVLKQVGADTRARYYLALERASGEGGCLKVILPEVTRDLRQRELFYLESYAASRLSHTHIARMGKPHELGGVYFCAVEYRQNACTLRELLNRSGWLDLDKAVDIADQIASALDHAHSLGVLHLQLQPESVLVEPGGLVAVKDFGIESGARLEWAYHERTRRLAAVYASAEQTTGAKIDNRSDLYSLGAILYEMLTDRVPFDSDDDDYIRRKQLDYAPAPPHLISMDVPEAVSSVVMKLLEKDPRNRFNRAEDFQASLRAAINRE
ncbi:MAG: serine/threonine-protein kinase [Blastocatellia bacterium]